MKCKALFAIVLVFSVLNACCHSAILIRDHDRSNCYHCLLSPETVSEPALAVDDDSVDEISSETGDTLKYDSYLAAILNNRHGNIGNLRKMHHGQPAATILYNPALAYFPKRNSLQNTNSYQLKQATHTNTDNFATDSSKITTFDQQHGFSNWLANSQQYKISAETRHHVSQQRWLEKHIVQGKLLPVEKQRHNHHDKGRYVKCEYTSSLPVRHARAAEIRDERMRPAIKRRTAAPDLTLCHFKICNMGRKRTTRYFHTIDELAHEN